MRKIGKPDVGRYGTPATIEQQAAWSDDGQGGNANANTWEVVRGGGSIPLMISLDSTGSGHGLRRSFQYGQQFPQATHYAECRYASDATIDATMTMVINSRRFQILGAVDHQLANVATILALVEWQAKGSM